MNMLAEMLLTEPAPVAIWAILMLLTLPALVVLASPAGVQNPRRALIETVAFLRRREERREEQRARRRQDAIQIVRFASEIRVAADQAGYAVRRWHGHWETAAERVDATWQAWQAADARWARSRATAAFGTPSTPQNPAEYADRERFLHRAVRAAADRGDLPAGAVADAVHGRGGWDARLHPVEQEAAVHRAITAHLEQLHRRAVAAERAAWHDAQLARRTRDSLRREADAAEVRAAGVRHLLPPVADAPLETGRRAALAPAA